MTITISGGSAGQMANAELQCAGRVWWIIAFSDLGTRAGDSSRPSSSVRHDKQPVTDA